MGIPRPPVAVLRFEDQEILFRKLLPEMMGRAYAGNSGADYQDIHPGYLPGKLLRDMAHILLSASSTCRPAPVLPDQCSAFEQRRIFLAIAPTLMAQNRSRNIFR